MQLQNNSITPNGNAAHPATENHLVLGSAGLQYRCIHDWPVPPAHIRWGDTHASAQDEAGNIYIAHTVHPESPSNDAVVVFDSQGQFLRSWGSRFKGGAHGLECRREGDAEYLYICDVANRLFVKTDLNGRVIWEKGAPKETGVYDAAHPFIPTNIAFAPNGDFYVTDGYGSYYIHQYDIEGRWIRTFGGPGSEPGKVLEPHGIWLDARDGEPKLAVADRANHRIQYFTLTGEHLSFVTEGMRRPCHFDTQGDLLLIPDLDSVVTILDRDNHIVAQLGDGHPTALRDAPREQFVPGQFVHPHGARFLQNGDILVTEWVPIGRVTLLQRVR